MTDDVSTLPAWPERLTYPVKAHEVIPFWVAEADAALARMEALVEVATELRSHLGYSGDADREALVRKLARLDALLAACDRSSAAQTGEASRGKEAGR